VRWFRNLIATEPISVELGCYGPVTWSSESLVIVPVFVHTEHVEKRRVQCTKMHFKKAKERWVIEKKEDLQVHEYTHPKRRTKIELGKLFSRAQVEPGSLVLDIGTGNGTIPKFLGTQVTVVGLDLWGDELDSLRKRALRSRRLSEAVWLLGDGRMMPLEANRFGLVTIFATLMFVRGLEDKRSVLEESYRVLRPKGRLVLAEPEVKDPKMCDISFELRPAWLGEVGVGFGGKGLLQSAELIRDMVRDIGFKITDEVVHQEHFELICLKPSRN
jgi:ubiquinone/menaquinone biosynthesis C-methylase UbiE